MQVYVKKHIKWSLTKIAEEPIWEVLGKLYTGMRLLDISELPLTINSIHIVCQQETSLHL